MSFAQGGPCDDFVSTTSVPQIAADLLHQVGGVGSITARQKCDSFQVAVDEAEEFGKFIADEPEELGRMIRAANVTSAVRKGRSAG